MKNRLCPVAPLLGSFCSRCAPAATHREIPSSPRTYAKGSRDAAQPYTTPSQEAVAAAGRAESRRLTRFAVERVLLPLRRRDAARLPPARRRVAAHRPLPPAPQRLARTLRGQAALGRGRRTRREAHGSRSRRRHGRARRAPLALRARHGGAHAVDAAESGRRTRREPRHGDAHRRRHRLRPVGRPPLA